MTHVLHRYQTALDMDMETMCEYPPSHHALPHWKLVLCSCSNHACIDLPSHESQNHHESTCTTIRFHVYHLFPWYSVHGRRPLEEKKIVACVCMSLLLCHPKNSTQEKILLLWKYLFLVFTQVSTFHKYKYEHFTYRMYAFQLHITVATHAVKHLKILAHFKMFWVDVIIPREWQLVLHIKFDQDNMAAIYMCLQKELYWIT